MRHLPTSLAPRSIHKLLLACLLAALLSPLSLAQPLVVEGGLAGGGPLPTAPTSAPGPHDCITPQERAAVMANIAAFEAAGLEPYAPRGPMLYEFYPHGGNWYRDLMLNNFVDLDSSSGIRDYHCTDFTYDGHNGHDNLARTFAEQDAGVPIFAALPGTVADRHDGEFDRNTTANNVPANYVVLSHGNGRYTWYWHMRQNSVLVNIGQSVRAGQQLGLTASSGYSNWPHLHFESRQNNATFEPFAGSCRPGATGWAAQIPFETSFRIVDFAFTPQNASTWPALPESPPRTGHLAFSERPHWFWLICLNLPANSTWRVRYFRPNGAPEYDSGTNAFNNSFYRWSWFYWWYTLPNMGTIPGTWRVSLDINGINQVDAPILVQATRDPNLNRPPTAITSLAFDPPNPLPDKVIFCRINNTLITDDPDYDLVRYQYVWTVNGTEIRRFTGAGMADAIPTNSFTSGQTLRCTVTPTDGRLFGPPISIQFPPARCISDFNDDGGVDGQDVEAFFLAWQASSPLADVNDDGGIDGQDVESFFTAWIIGTC